MQLLLSYMRIWQILITIRYQRLVIFREKKTINMIYDVPDQLISLLKANVTSLKDVGYYTGEFDNDKSEWNPQFPIVLVAINSLAPDEIAVNTIAVSNEMIDIYCAIKYNELSGRQTFDQVVSFFNNINFNFPSYFPIGTKIMIKNIALHGFYFGIHIYRIEIETRLIME